jgi:carboxyl-terminal processing protease
VINRLFTSGAVLAFAAACLMAGAELRAQESRTVGLAALASRSVAGAETFDAAWTIIRDTHFDPNLNGLDWNAVKAELRPRAAAARDAGELRTVIREMLGRLGQSHFTIIPGSADSRSKAIADMSGDPGVDVRLVGDAMVVTSVEPQSSAQAAGVKPGWKVLAFAGTPLGPLIAELPAEARTRQVEGWRIAQERLRGAPGSNVRVTFEDEGGRSRDVALARQTESGQPVTVGHLPTMYVRVESERRQLAGGGTAGIIRFNVWMAAVDREFQKAMDSLRDADGIVIDLRGNPGGLAAMLMGISGHFLDERKVLGTMKTRETELRFVANPRRVSAAGDRVQPFAGPVAILVDAMTGSASECFAGGMQGIKRARVFGQVTMGQALPALFDKLPNGDVLIHAYGDFVAADGTRLEGRGVVPDEIVPLTREELASGRDLTLEAALRWVSESRP